MKLNRLEKWHQNHKEITNWLHTRGQTNPFDLFVTLTHPQDCGYAKYCKLLDQFLKFVHRETFNRKFYQGKMFCVVEGADTGKPGIKNHAHLLMTYPEKTSSFWNKIPRKFFSFEDMIDGAWRRAVYPNESDKTKRNQVQIKISRYQNRSCAKYVAKQLAQSNGNDCIIPALCINIPPFQEQL